MVRLALAQNVFEPELSTLVVGFQMCHLSGICTNAIAPNITFFLGESDGSVIHTSFETVVGAAAVTISVSQCLYCEPRLGSLDLRILKASISDTFLSEQLDKELGHFQSLLWCSWDTKVRNVFVRSFEGFEIVLECAYSLTSLFTGSSLRTSARSAYTLEAAAVKYVGALLARYQNSGGVVDGQFLSLVDMTDGMGDKCLGGRYVVNLQVRDT